MKRLVLKAGRLLLPALVAALLVGCSLVQLAYNHADQWVLREADRYLSLRDGQRQQLKAALRERLERHRVEELSDFVDFLDQVERAAVDRLAAAEVEALMVRLEGLVETTLAGTVPPIAAVLATLEPDQLDHLRATLADDDRRYRKRYVQPAAERRVAKRTKAAVRALEHWTGELSAGQRERVGELVSGWPDLADEFLGYRKARTAGLVALLEGRPGADAIGRYLVARWLLYEGRNPRLVEGAAVLRAGIADLIVTVDAALTPEQRAAFLGRVRDYRDELASLLPSPRPALADSRVPTAASAFD
jgi:hypothetical protein